MVSVGVCFYVLGETMGYKCSGDESREKKETAGFKKLPKLPQGGHLLVYAGNSRVDHQFFSQCHIVSFYSSLIQLL